MSKTVDAKYQTGLQRKIFSRWINQKLVPNKLAAINDCVEDFKDGFHLVQLLQVLSEKDSGIKGIGPQTARMKQIDQASRALKFVEECGVDQKLKTSPENLVDGLEQPILALIWAIMLKFLKFSDDDDESKLSAEDALLMWVSNQVPSDIKVESFSKSFKDGMALCALMAKYRPKLLSLATCDASKPEDNLKTVFACAEKCFGLEQYLTPVDFQSLDSKSMMIYVADYYIGAAQMRKVDLGVRRITKLVSYTRTNDAMKVEYKSTAAPLRTRVDDALNRLREHVINDTMAGAVSNMDAFNKYKQNEKGQNVGDFLRCENIFNSLSLRLADHHHPAFNPGSNLTPSDFSTTFAAIEEQEKQKSKALADELNRQIKLSNIYQQHKTRASKLELWTKAKLQYLNFKEAVDSSGAAKYHLNVLKSYVAEAENVKISSWVNTKKQGAELVSERFEHSTAVQAAEGSISANLSAMDKAYATKQAILDDDLARELYKEKINLVAEAHSTRFGSIDHWIKEKLAYTNKKEEISSVSDAQLQLSLLAAYDSNKVDLDTTSLPNLADLAKQVLVSEYKTDLSSWEYPNKQMINERENFVQSSWATLATQSAQKKLVLEDDLAREKYREEIRLCNMEHADRSSTLQAWIEQKEAYLDVREMIDTVDKAQQALQSLAAYKNENGDMSKTAKVGLKTLGQRIISAQYKTALSQWISPDVESVKQRESLVDAKWATLANKSAAKQTFLDTELARELQKEDYRLQIAELSSDFINWTATMCEDVKGSHFGFFLEDVEAFGSELSTSDRELNLQGDTKQRAYKVVFDKATAIGVQDNRYTTTTPSDWEREYGKVQAESISRAARYGAELARQKANDSLDREFATLVDGIAKAVDGFRHEVVESKKELKDQLLYVKERLACTEHSSKLPRVVELDSQIKAANFSVRHTTTSALDVDITWVSYQTFLQSKSAALAAEILHKELRGVSLEEYQQIEAQFKQFDKNNTNDLSDAELKACLYSLGQEVNKAKVHEIMTKFGEGGKMKYNGFKEFMITELGDTDTATEILAAFEVINQGAAVAKVAIMMELLADADVDFIKGEAPAVGCDYDYQAFTVQVFAR